MFSMCSKPKPKTPSIVQHTQIGPVAKQVKGGYLLRYKRQLFWNCWSEEWVVLYDDSTMAWFTERGRSSPVGKILVKEAPEMLAIAHWTGQIPKRPPVPDSRVTHLIALGSRRKRSKVYWMLAKSEQEVSEWIEAITKTLPPPPQIELVVNKPHLMNVLRRPLVRIRPATNSEVKARRVQSTPHNAIVQNPPVKSNAAIAILCKNVETKGSLGCALPWGHGWGWATLPNGVWSGGLTWSQCEDTFTLHALPTTHCTNLGDSSAAFCHGDIGGFDFHAGVEDLGGEDFDCAMDFGDFIF